MAQLPPAAHKGPHKSRPPFEMVQSNVALANTYRLELNKQVIGIATALFAFTISFFLPAPFGSPAAAAITTYKPLAWIGWICLAAAILCGLYQLRAWEQFYLTYRLDNKDKSADAELKREGITATRRLAMVVQYTTFVLGLVATGLFAAFRLGL